MTRSCASVWTAVAVIACCWLHPGCSDESPDATPKLPVLEELEPAVAAKIQRTHADVLATGSPASWIRYAKTLHAHDLSRDAAEAYLVAARHVEGPEKFELLYLAGNACAKPDPDRAIALFEEASKLRDDYVPLHLRAGELLVAAQRWNEAGRHYSRALDLCLRMKGSRLVPTSHALLGLARVALAEGRPAEAVELLERARAIHPDHEDVLAQLVLAYARAGRNEDAARVSAQVGNLENPQGFNDPIVTAMSREGVSYLAFAQFGVAAMRGQQFEEALAAFDRALEIRPAEIDALSNRANALVGLERFEEAQPILDRVLAARPRDVVALSMRAGCAMSRRDLPEAASYLRRALAVDPRQVDALWNLGRIVRALGRPAEAERHFRAILDRKPHRADARLELAGALAEQGKNGEALDEVNRVLAARPDDPRAQALKARLAP